MDFGLQCGGIEFIMIRKAWCWSLICLITLLQSEEETERTAGALLTSSFFRLSEPPTHRLVLPTSGLNLLSSLNYP